ncbi:unnamed protein product [Durusdinium trenchii]|uniref:TIR domain-containing protein n=1 Tax=Durusdinium trenchii TaxID=1381693 RepID=A0ABP0MEN1_9DINO
MELQKRGSRFTTFVDCDDLNDLTRLFSYVGQDTETLVVLASPDILTRKWCVGEICTARIQRRGEASNSESQSANPDKTFIESYSSIVPDITELANYNLGLVAAWFDSSLFSTPHPAGTGLASTPQKQLLAISRFDWNWNGTPSPLIEHELKPEVFHLGADPEVQGPAFNWRVVLARCVMLFHLFLFFL